MNIMIDCAGVKCSNVTGRLYEFCCMSGPQNTATLDNLSWLNVHALPGALCVAAGVLLFSLAWWFYTWRVHGHD